MFLTVLKEKPKLESAAMSMPNRVLLLGKSMRPTKTEELATTSRLVTSSAATRKS